MDHGVIAIGRVVQAGARREVERAGDLFIEENVEQRPADEGIDPEGELTDETGARVGVENLVEKLAFVRAGGSDAPFVELKLDALVDHAVIDAPGGEADAPLDRLADRCGIDLTVGQIVLSGAGDDRHLLDREAQVGSRSLDAHTVGLRHQPDQRRHGRGHFGIVEGADRKIKILKRLAALLGQLRHGRMGPAQHYPAGFGDADRLVHRLPPESLVEAHLFFRDVGQLGAVVRPAQADVGLHARHLRRFQTPHLLHTGGVAEPVEFAQHQVLLEVDQGDRLHAPRFADQGDHHLRRDVGRLYEEPLARLQAEGVMDDGSGECCETRVRHVFS